MLEVINPADGTLVRRYPEANLRDARDAVARAHRDQIVWQKTGFTVRRRCMQTAAAVLRRRSRELAQLMTLEMGKPVSDALAEIEKCALVCEYYAEGAEAMLAAEITLANTTRSYWVHRPLGVVLAVMPWNFPFWQVFRFAAPNLMAGNAGVLKHASNVPGCALAIEEVFREAGFPEHLFRAVLVGSDVVGMLLEDEHVRAVTVTGSVSAGRAVAERAGALLKKSVLELGGSDPYLVLKDADLDLAAEVCAKSRLINSGQSCIAAKRFIVVGEVYDDFLQRFVAHMAAARVGNPMDERTEVGPQARVDLRDDLHDQVVRSVGAGACVVLGGAVPDRNGAWYPPTVLIDVQPGMPAWEEELFGPVASVIRARDEEDTIRIANATMFGLGAAVFTQDLERGERIARDHLEAGSCFVNAFVRSDPRLPFGGIKESGYGRELSPLGIREFVNVKTVCVS
ncbi:MAG: NAD-dependent succinate-semialdehyde dehydrogenase [Gemmatimonadota bacterium]|nr:NAD-dependent succinate-semialdehyde dehydrogenase [Gemmatimonadota bacterium]